MLVLSILCKKTTNFIERYLAKSGRILFLKYSNWGPGWTWLSIKKIKTLQDNKYFSHSGEHFSCVKELGNSTKFKSQYPKDSTCKFSGCFVGSLNTVS